MKYCAACILPDTRPNLVIGPDGICNACTAHKNRPEIDWDRRAEQFQQIVRDAKTVSRGYDCLIPVSGGKDSTWQTVTCLEQGLNPLTFSYAPPRRTEIGRRNLQNLIGLGVDHLDYQINPETERTFLLETLTKFGNAGTPMHMAIMNMARALAYRFDIPLIIWGEDSSVEYGGAEADQEGYEMNQAWLHRYGVSHGTTADDWVSEGGLDHAAMTPFRSPDDSELAEKGIQAVFLGYFFEWDPVTTGEVAAKHGMVANTDGPRTGYYKFADLDDEFISVHHWLKWYKFGFTRLFDNLSIEIRNRRLPRDEAIAIVREIGDQTPTADIESFCEFCGISTKRFSEIAEQFRNRDIWVKRQGTWMIDGFLIPDWEWT